MTSTCASIELTTLQSLIEAACSGAASCVALTRIAIDAAAEFETGRDVWMEQVEGICRENARRARNAKNGVTAYDEERICPVCGFYFTVTIGARPGRTRKYCSTCCSWLSRQHKHRQAV